MTYEEMLEEAEFRGKELCGIGKHDTVMGAKRAYAEAEAALAKLEAATYLIHKEMRLKGYELYLTE